jgi:hypothetical protein
MVAQPAEPVRPLCLIEEEVDRYLSNCQTDITIACPAGSAELD